MPGIEDACALGINSSQSGEAIGLVCVAKEQVTNDQIFRFLIKNLAPWQIPEKILRLREIPLTPIGKVDRMRIRQLLTALDNHKS
jgi:acyl-CoA synthetase (AMP-forming)/AMP-acid ligase II